MANKTIYKITITNWDKYNQNKKRGHPCVFISTGFLNDAKVKLLTPTGVLLYLSCLLLAGESASSQFEVNHESLASQSRVKSGSLQSQLDVLQSLQVLAFEKIDLLINIKEKKVIEKKRIYIAQSVPDVSKSDIENLYSKFPRKEGKSRGMKILQSQIKTKQDLESLAKAIDKYAALQVGKEKQYIKQFSTFASCWRDYLDHDVGNCNLPKEKEPDWMIRERERERSEMKEEVI